jgi:hypothetical protein
LFLGNVEIEGLVAMLDAPRDHEHGAVTEEGLLEAIKVQTKRRLVAENQGKPARLGLVYLLVRPKEPEPRLFMFMFMGANITRQILAGVEVRQDQVSFKVSLGTFNEKEPEFYLYL